VEPTPDLITYHFEGTGRFYADDVNLLGDNVDTIKKNTQTLIDASKEVGPEVNTEKLSICCCLITIMQGKIANRCLENVAQFRYLGMTITNQNWIQEEIKRRLNSSNACYHSIQNLLSSRLLSKNIKIRIYKSIILPVVPYGCENLVSDIKGET
jgi:hypothetical protein